jgi:hypothetical protein
MTKAATTEAAKVILSVRVDRDLVDRLRGRVRARGLKLQWAVAEGIEIWLKKNA